MTMIASQSRASRTPVFIAAVIAGLLLAAGTSFAQSPYDPIRIVSSDARALVVDIAPRLRFDTLGGGDLLPVVEGGSALNMASPGAPMRTAIRFPVGLPGPTGNRLEVVSVEYASVIRGRIAPVPRFVTTNSGMLEPRYVVDASAYVRQGTIEAGAELRYDGIARDLHVGAIVVSPCQVDPVGRTIRPVRLLRLRLTYAASDRGSRGPTPPGLVMSGALLNGPVAPLWTAPPGRTTPLFPRASARSTARAWMRVDVKEEGLYSLTAEDFQRGGIDLSTVDPARIAIYGGPATDLPEMVSSALNNQMRQIPTVVETADGRVSRVLFYAVGPTGWVYRGGTDTVPTHVSSPYVTANSYIVAIDGDPVRTFSRKNAPGGSPVDVMWGIARFVYEEEKYNAVAILGQGGSGRDWFSSQFTIDAGRSSDTRVYERFVAELDRSRFVHYRVRVANAARSESGGGSGTFAFNQNNIPVGSPILINSLSGESIALASSRLFVGNGADIAGDNRSMLGVTYTNRGIGSGYLDWYEIHYGRRLAAQSDQIRFDAPSGNGVGRFVVTNFSSDDVIALDVTDPVNPEFLDGNASGGNFTFTDLLYPVRSNRSYYLAGRSSARRVDNVAKASFADLRGRSLDADIIVVAADDLKEDAEKYAAFRTSRGEFKAVSVTVGEIYTEYSNGRLDPTAIRDFIADAVNRWTPKPTYVVLLGDGSYDYRMIATRQAPLVPPYETNDGDAYDHINSSSFDDYYVRVIGDDRIVDLAIGRIPVETSEQAEQFLNKMKRYETNRNFGLWRQNIILAADDDYPINDGGGFTGQSESLWRDLIPGWIEPLKLYLGNYPAPTVGVRKIPAAEQDLELYMDRGAVITNWVGHGNPNVWAHEGLLEKEKFITRLTNDSVLTYVAAVTCNFGYFDDPAVLSGAELFVQKPDGGAIAVMTATRAVYIPPNERLMRQHFKYLFSRDPAGSRYVTIGQALNQMKLQGSGDISNDEKFFLLGDPSLRLNLPRDSVDIVSVNSTNVATDTALIGALSVVTVEGVIRTPDGQPRDDFHGVAIVSLYDADRTVTVSAGTTSPKILYYGGRLFRGPANVASGRFTATFRVPKDIAYDTATGRLHVYAYNSTEDASGVTTHVKIFGSDTALIVDREGPAIRIFMDDRSFGSGDVVTPEPVLIVDLSDTSGINSSGAGLGHRIEAWFDNSPRSVDLTDSYQTLPTDYRQGSAQKRILDLSPGEHTVRVRAWDIYNNPSETTTSFRIMESGQENLRIVDVVNYPNPMERETQFLFRHNQTAPLDVDIDIFTPAGRKVRHLEARSVSDRFVRVPWDGADADGRFMANGVYLYRLRVRVVGDESKSFETIEKVAVVR